jgi:hypothetical protein
MKLSPGDDTDSLGVLRLRGITPQFPRPLSPDLLDSVPRGTSSASTATSDVPQVKRAAQSRIGNPTWDAFSLAATQAESAAGSI